MGDRLGWIPLHPNPFLQPPLSNLSDKVRIYYIMGDIFKQLLFHAYYNEFLLTQTEEGTSLSQGAFSSYLMIATVKVATSRRSNAVRDSSIPRVACVCRKFLL